MGIESSQKGAMCVRMSWMSVGWAISGASGGAGPAQVLLEHVDQCRDLHDHGRFLAKWNLTTKQDT